MQVSEIPEAGRAAVRQPWLAASLSWLLPGIGQLYCGAYRRAVAFVLLFVILYGVRAASLLSDRLSLIASLALCASVSILFGICVSVDAFRAARRLHPADDEWKRAYWRNPYFAAFLTVILPGLGHIYMRRWIVGVVFLVTYLAIDLMALRIAYAAIAVVVLKVLAPAHVLATSAIQSRWQPRRAWPFVGFIAISLLASGGLALLQAHFGLLASPVGGYSMAPTMVRGSFIIVDTLTYRYREPVVGDIVMLNPPKDAGTTPGIPVCKRIVAIGGQTIQVQDGLVYIDGTYKEPAPVRGPFTWRTSRGGSDSSLYRYAVAEPYRVPENHYFVMGDNRGDSLDSRSYGPVPRESIVGRVAKVYTLPYHLRQYDRRVDTLKRLENWKETTQPGSLGN